MHDLLKQQFKEQGLMRVTDSDYLPIPGVKIIPVITLDDMRDLVTLLDVGGISGKTTIIIDHDTAQIFAQLRADMEGEL